MKKSRLFYLILVLAIVIGMIPVIAFAENGNGTANNDLVFSDMPDNWSTEALENAVSNGLLNGMDGKIMPDDNLTRAQMAAVIVRAFGATVKGDLTGYSDVNSSDWFADYMAKAYQMGVIEGSNKEMNPNDFITRQEVFVILSRALKLQSSDTINTTFSDVIEISDWAEAEIYAIVNAGYVEGSNGELNPQDLITRAQFAQILDNIMQQYISSAGVYTTVADGNIMINAAGVTLKDLTVNGDLIIGDGVGDGDFILDNVKVTGRMIVRGGGENSVTIKGASSVSNIIVSRVDGVVSIKVEGDADVEVIYVDDGSNDVNVEGTIGNIEVEAYNVTVNAIGATIDNIGITGENSIVVIDAKSTVDTVNIQEEAANSQVIVTGTVTTITTNAAGTEISGTGTVTTVNAQTGATDTSIETPNTKIVVADGVTGVTGGGGEAISGGTTETNNSTGTDIIQPSTGEGGSSTPTVSVTNVSVTSSTTVTITSTLSGLSFKLGTVALTAVESGTGPYSYSVTIPAANALEVGTNNITVMKDGYKNYTAVANFKIQTAINAATAGDTITVSAGTYYENLTINKAITIQGADQDTTIIDGGGSGVVVTITASNVTLSGFTIRNSGSDVTECAGVGIVGTTALAQNDTIQNCTVKDNATGIALMGARNCTVSNCNITNNDRYGVVLEVSPYNPALFSTANSITGNMITGNDRDGIYVGLDCNTNSITNNTISGAAGTLEGTETEAEANGIYLWKNANNTITGNTVSSNAKYGIEMMGSSGNTITGNEITGNLDGLHIRNINETEYPGYSIRNNTISQNKIYDNTRVNLYASPNFSFNVENNWWGSAIESEIVAKIASWDASGNVVPGTTVYIDYSPWASNAECTEFAPAMLTHSGVNTGYSTISDAITAAETGDTITVSAGTYYENLMIEKAITIQGADQDTTIIDGDDSGIVVSITASGVTLSGLTIQNSGSDINTCAGIGIVGTTALAQNDTIQNCTVKDNATGIALMGARNCTVSNCNITNNDRYGVVLEVSPYNPALFSTANSITGNIITGNARDGIYVGLDCNTNSITNNTISGAAGTLEGTETEAEAEANGIYLWKNANNTITGNTVSSNAKYGIEMMGSSGNTITGNEITGNYDGLHIRNTADTSYSITNNTISLNNIYNNTRVNLYANPNFSFNVENNWWGSEIESEIVAKIASWDASGEIVPGTTVYIDYSPWLTTTE